MQSEECAIVAPAAKLMLVAMLVALAHAESTDGPVPEVELSGSEPLLKRLAKLTLSELERLADTGALRIIVSCDRAEIAWSLQASARRRAEQSLLEYFIRHGAPRKLLRALFSVSRGQVEAIRKRLRITPVAGRPKLPRSREREAIVVAWAKLGAAADRRAGYHELHRMFPRYSIATLDQVLREALPEEAPTARASGNRLRSEPISPAVPPGEEAPDRAFRAVVHRRVPR